MKKTLLFAFAGSLFIAGCHSINNQCGYTIQGTINAMDSGWAYLLHDDSTGLVQDSAPIKDHKFSFAGKVAEPVLYHLWVGKGSLLYGPFRDVSIVILKP